MEMDCSGWQCIASLQLLQLCDHDHHSVVLFVHSSSSSCDLPVFQCALVEDIYVTCKCREPPGYNQNDSFRKFEDTKTCDIVHNCNAVAASNGVCSPTISNQTSESLPVQDTPVLPVYRLPYIIECGKLRQISVTSHLAGCIREEISKSDAFLNSFVKYVVHKGIGHQRLTCLSCQSKILTKNASCTPVLVIVSMTSLGKVWLNYDWCYRIGNLVIKRMILDDAMNWLSTLGGAYSALGDYFVHHAITARTISLQQLRIALEMGSPPVVIRCHLYYALSLMQTGQLRRAQSLIRKKYDEAKLLPVVEKQLLNMCRGLWSRLKYLKTQQRRMLTPARTVEGAQKDIL